MIIKTELSELLLILRKPEMIRKQNLGLPPDQTFLKRFLRKGYNQSETHKQMEDILVSELLSKGVATKSEIIVEKRPFRDYRFRPDVSVLKDDSYTLFECHYHDGWGHEDICKTHLYNNIEAVKNMARIVICVTNKFDSDKPIEKRRRKLLKNVHEVWVLDLENGCIKRKIVNN